MQMFKLDEEWFPFRTCIHYFHKVTHNLTTFFQIQTIPSIMTPLVAEIIKAFLEKV